MEMESFEAAYNCPVSPAFDIRMYSFSSSSKNAPPPYPRALQGCKGRKESEKGQNSLAVQLYLTCCRALSILRLPYHHFTVRFSYPNYICFFLCWPFINSLGLLFELPLMSLHAP